MIRRYAIYPLIISFALVVSAMADDAKFSDTELLISTLTADDQAGLDTANADLESAQAAFEELKGADPAPTQEELDDAEKAVADAQTAVDEAQNGLESEITDTEAAVAQLSEEQVYALNRSLNNAADGKLLVDIDAEDLRQVIDGEYNQLQINAFTQSFEQEARFNNKADRFNAKYEETGNEKFLDHATRMEEKGAAQKEKFQAKIERFSDSPSSEAGKLAKQEAKSTAKEAAKQAAKGAAKKAVKGAAKQAAKKAAKDAAKNSAKKAAKKAAK